MTVCCACVLGPFAQHLHVGPVRACFARCARVGFMCTASVCCAYCCAPNPGIKTPHEAHLDVITVRRRRQPSGNQGLGSELSPLESMSD